MNIEYEIIENDGTPTIVGTLPDGTKLFIPADPMNKDYREYLVYVEAQQ